MSEQRTRPCDRRTIEGRFRKAEQFLDAAETIREFASEEADVGDAYVTLCVHAGIAAADVVCCIALGSTLADRITATPCSSCGRWRPTAAI